MKKTVFLLLAATVMVACGNKAKEAEQARLDSIAEAARLDSIAEVARLDSIAMSDSIAKLQAIADSVYRADSIAAAEASKKVTKKVAQKANTKSSKPTTTLTNEERERINKQLGSDDNQVTKRTENQPQKTKSISEIKEEAKKNAREEKLKKFGKKN